MQIKKPEVREKIIKAAIKEFTEKDFINGSTRQIAANAGISRGNLYKYFKSKDELFIKIVAPCADELLNYLEQRIDKGYKDNMSNSGIEIMSYELGKLIHNNSMELVLLLTKSDGSSYSSYKINIIDKLSFYYRDIVRKDLLENSFFLVKLLAKNFYDAIVIIARETDSEETALMNLRLLFKFHTSGGVDFVK